MLHSDSDDNEKDKNQQLVEADLKTTESVSALKFKYW
jgi:hypothetical protein